MITLKILLPDGTEETYTFRSNAIVLARKAYDNAVRLGYFVSEFSSVSGYDMRDQPQSAIGYDNNSNS